MPLKYSPKVFLIFELPDGTTHQDFFRQWQKLGDIISALWTGGRTKLDQDKSIGELGLKHDDIIAIQRENTHTGLLERILKRG